MSEGVAEPADLRPAPSGERRRPVWVVPDEVPAIVPRAARFTEARWVAKYRRAPLLGDFGAALFGVSLAVVAPFGAPIKFCHILLRAVLPVASPGSVAVPRG